MRDKPRQAVYRGRLVDGEYSGRIGPGLTMGVDVSNGRATAVVGQMIDGVLHIVWEGRATVPDERAPARATSA